MRLMLTMIAGLLFAGSARSGDVYVVTDDQGNRVYTDRPQTLPAERTGIHSATTDPAEVQARNAEEMKRLAATDSGATNQQAGRSDAATARKPTADDRDKLCADARKRYDTLMFNFRIYEIGPDGERRYLDSAEIDAARAEARQLVQQFCGSD